jgi:ketosteroid isomerase-like protein
LDSTRVQTADVVAELGQRWAAAERGGDADALGELLAEDFVAVGPRGFVLDKKGWLSRHSSGALAVESFTWTDVEVHDHGEAAVAVGVQESRSSFAGQATAGRFRVTQVWTRVDRSWLIASLHLCAITAP